MFVFRCVPGIVIDGVPTNIDSKKEFPPPKCKGSNSTFTHLHKEIYLRSDKTGATVPNVIHRIILQEKDIIEYLHSQKNSAASEFIDFDNMLKTLSLIKRIYNGENIFANIRTFISALSIIAYLDKEKKN